MSCGILHRVAQVRTDVSEAISPQSFEVKGFLGLLSSQRGYASRWTAKRASCKGTSTVVSIRYRGYIVDGPLLRRFFLDWPKDSVLRLYIVSPYGEAKQDTPLSNDISTIIPRWRIYTTVEVPLQVALFPVRREAHPRCSRKTHEHYHPDDGGDVPETSVLTIATRFDIPEDIHHCYRRENIPGGSVLGPYTVLIFLYRSLQHGASVLHVWRTMECDGLKCRIQTHGTGKSGHWLRLPYTVVWQVLPSNGFADKHVYMAKRGHNNDERYFLSGPGTDAVGSRYQSTGYDCDWRH
jgi:hypothetical protein